MPQLRKDQFIHQLKKLMGGFPEYAPLLDLLIDQVEKGKKEKIQAKLRQLQNEDW